MRYTLYASLDDLLSPETLSRLSGQRITAIERRPVASQIAASANQFLTVDTNAGTGPRYIVKRISAAGDWVMRASGDTSCREALLWQHGVLDCLPPETTHAIVACSHDADGWALLMRDATPALLPADGGAITGSDIDAIIDALAALHAHFWEQPALQSPALGLCRLEHLYTCLGPASGYGRDPQADEVAGAHDARGIWVQPFNRVVLRMIGDGWRLLESLVDPDVARIIRALVEDPQPLCNALVRYPWTLLHGDPRPANLGLERTGRGRLLLLDWQLASCGPPAIDLAWFIDCATPDLRIEDRDVVIERYRRALARRIGDRFDEGWWQPQLELSLLGQFVRDAWFMLYEAAHGASPEARARAQSDLHWWSDRTREGAAWL